MRKLASIELISAIHPIENADAIVVAVVRGWHVVVRKDEFQVGDRVVFCEIDSWIPHKLAPFLSHDQEPREYEGIKGEKLRTVKLRGQLSQGLVIPVPEELAKKKLQVGDDVSELLGIVKYEPPIPAELAGLVKGPWPLYIPHPDQERIQNLEAELATWQSRDLHFEVTEKLDGSSATFCLDLEDEFHVCSRKLNLAFSETNSFWRMAQKYKIEERMRELNLQGFALQAELLGPGIQKNKYKRKEHDIFVYGIFNARSGQYLAPDERRAIIFELGVSRVPAIENTFSIRGHTVESLLKYAEGSSKMIEIEREGVVFKCIEDPTISFKAVSNKFLLKYKD